MNVYSLVANRGSAAKSNSTVFNLYNNANLTNYGGDLTSAAFGQPTSRATQVFGSGGPRAFQLALRLTF